MIKFQLHTYILKTKVKTSRLMAQQPGSLKHSLRGVDKNWPEYNESDNFNKP